jgi:hypothetical protein
MISEKEFYIAPDIDLLIVSVEQGFANSIEDPVEDDEMDW